LRPRPPNPHAYRAWGPPLAATLSANGRTADQRAGGGAVLSL